MTAWRAGAGAGSLFGIVQGAHDAALRRRHAEEVCARDLVAKGVVHEHRPGLPVHLARDHVADVVQVAGHAGEVGRVRVEPGPGQDVERDPGREVRVAEPVLGVPEPLHHPVGRRDPARVPGLERRGDQHVDGAWRHLACLPR